MRAVVERVWFFLCLLLARLLRSARYSTAGVIERDGELLVRKRRRFYAPILIWMSDPLMRILDTGVRVLPRQAWHERERQLWASLHGAPVRFDAHGGLLMPVLPGQTLAAILDTHPLDDATRARAIELAVLALADLHAKGLTHGDAMAENVMVDLEAGVARWFDFETVHEASRAIAWRRADDLRALLATCLVRTTPAAHAPTVDRVLDLYADPHVSRLVAMSFAPVVRRPLVLHLGQAALSFEAHREIARILRRRLDRTSNPETDPREPA